MQELIKTFHLYQNSACTTEELEILSFYIKCAEDLVEKEKEQIIDASKHSYIAGYLDNQCKVDESMNFPEEYYNQKYNNDPTRTNSNI